MIYLNRSVPVISLPKHSKVSVGMFTLTLYSKLNTAVVIVSKLSNRSNSPFFYSFVAMLDNVPDGEYIYKLTLGDEVLETGLAVVGDFEKKDIIVNKTQTNKLQYNGKNKLKTI